MASNKTRVIAFRVRNEVAEYYKDKNLREIVERMYDNPDTELEDMCFLYDIGKETLLKNVRWLLDSKKLYVKDGKLHWNPKAIDEDYFSLDDKVEALQVSEKEKEKIKRAIAENLERMTEQGGV